MDEWMDGWMDGWTDEWMDTWCTPQISYCFSGDHNKLNS